MIDELLTAKNNVNTHILTPQYRLDILPALKGGAFSLTFHKLPSQKLRN